MLVFSVKNRCGKKNDWSVAHLTRINSAGSHYDHHSQHTYILSSVWVRLSIFSQLSIIHPCEKVIGMFFQNQIWSRLSDINRLCLVCIERSIEEVKKCQISKHGYHQGPSDKSLKKARCQFCDVKFGHCIMEAVGFFDYKMHSLNYF